MEQREYYLVPVRHEWRLKRAGGIRVLRSFASKAEALAYAQALISRQQARFRVQRFDGTWEDL